VDVFAGKKHVAIIDPATHTNIGDLMIWKGEIEFVQSLGLRVDLTCGKCQDNAKWMRNCNVDEFGRDWILVYQGGGNWGKTWIRVHQCRRKRIRELSKRGADLLQMPCSVWFGNEFERRNLRFWNEEVEFWNSTVIESNFVVGFRQEDSFRLMSENINAFKSIRVPDIAFALNLPNAESEAEVDVVFLLRRDKESALIAGLNSVEAFLSKQKFSFLLKDWSDLIPEADELEPFPERMDQLIQAGSDYISKGKIVITDRLHASILSFLTRKPFIYIDNSYGKLSGTLELAFRDIPECLDEKISGIHAKDIEDAVSKARGLLKVVD
jgi:pyruvyl transferase EpsO